MIRLACVVGDPISHSRSPRLHAAWLARHQISGAYLSFRVKKEDFETTLRRLRQAGFVGCNVTLPHKEAALRLADRASEAAQRIGAANMLTFTAAGLEADNTDCFGFLENIRARFPDWRPKRVAVLGAGGAARAVLAALAVVGVAEVRISNRTKERAERLALEFKATAVTWEERDAMLDGCDTLVNTTSLGMTGRPPLDLPLEALPKGALVTDLIYDPLETSLLRRAKERGNPVVGGIGMLVYQAVPAFERWFGQRPRVDQRIFEALAG